jgi:hypothetical protein
LFNINQVSYDSGVHVDQGKELTPTQVKNEPTKVNWLAEEGSNYTLCMTGNKDKDIYSFLHSFFVTYILLLLLEVMMGGEFCEFIVILLFKTVCILFI